MKPGVVLVLLEQWTLVDGRDMAALVDALPEHIEQSLTRLAESPWRPTVRTPSLLAVGGMGGSAIAGELTAAAGALLAVGLLRKLR